jgi:hypothetical protein
MASVLVEIVRRHVVPVINRIKEAWSQLVTWDPIQSQLYCIRRFHELGYGGHEEASEMLCFFLGEKKTSSDGDEMRRIVQLLVFSIKQDDLPACLYQAVAQGLGILSGQSFPGE